MSGPRLTLTDFVLLNVIIKAKIPKTGSGGILSDGAHMHKPVALQHVCADFILDNNLQPWYLGAHTDCRLDPGGSKFRPQWKKIVNSAILTDAFRIAEELNVEI